ncbi:lytic transglycosylase domain-containing protein [Nocardioides conyzicola]|uniref:Lytic transglycosylase domain-containing protein n=1 Tax=Nocardioides conyzicola TaxID=1651781 RepID=A0ABP8XNR1_9ACTN
MSKHKKYVPKHRHVAEPTLLEAPKKALRTGVVLTSVAVAVTGIAVSGGVLGSGAGQVAATAQDLHGDLTDGRAPQASAALDRTVTSRSADRRRKADPVKVSSLSTTSGPARTATVDLSAGDPRDIARALMGQFGFGADQFGCLDSLWMRESGWNPHADNPSSSAYGIPQALPGSKMASAGADWATNPATQIMWGLGYIQDRYGSPCGAWAHSQARGFY